jgi:hypothetical protein
VGSVAAVAAMWIAARSTPSDDCALPGIAQLEPHAQADAARHVLACRDLEHGRITAADYRKLLGLDAPAPTPAIEWASSVRAVSSEYNDTTYAARQVLGAPNVYPRSGDLAGAWASKQPDAGDEFIEVGFAHPTRARAIQIYETFNPGAVRSVEITTASGRREVVYDNPNVGDTGIQIPPALIQTVDLQCTSEPVAAVRVTLASGVVPGWNELDAIGLQPCP